MYNVNSAPSTGKFLLSLSRLIILALIFLKSVTSVPEFQMPVELGIVTVISSCLTAYPSGADFSINLYVPAGMFKKTASPLLSETLEVCNSSSVKGSTNANTAPANGVGL